jgi:hypothetical protein
VWLSVPDLDDNAQALQTKVEQLLEENVKWTSIAEETNQDPMPPYKTQSPSIDLLSFSLSFVHQKTALKGSHSSTTTFYTVGYWLVATKSGQKKKCSFHIKS